MSRAHKAFFNGFGCSVTDGNVIYRPDLARRFAFMVESLAEK